LEVGERRIQRRTIKKLRGSSAVSGFPKAMRKLL
jgi:hypothetical protein